jgi:FkbM family methyltransferase
MPSANIAARARARDGLQPWLPDEKLVSRMSLRRAAKSVLPRGVANRIRVAAYRWTLRRFRPYQARRLWAGYPFDLWISDPTSESWYGGDVNEVPSEISFLANHRLRAGATVFDCGAHQCVVAMVLAKFVGTSGKVIAVEAGPLNYDTGLRNVRVNDARNVTVVHAAVSDDLNPIEFNVRGNGQVDDGTGAWGKVAVPGITIDELTRRHGAPDVLFVDVEGFESRVLNGAAETLSRNHPDCFVEMHVGCGLEKFGGSVKSIAELFRRLGYQLWMSAPTAPNFISFSDDSPIVAKRFFLIAIAAS